jgi:hypothetical protein
MRWPGLAALGWLAVVSAKAASPPDAAHQTCVDVSSGGAQSYACLNERLAAMAAQQHRASTATDAPVSATSPSNVTGVFNESATRNRLGPNFGHSVTPDRPHG